MQQRKAILIILITALILTLSALGGVWGRSYAQGTVPTEEPTEEPGTGSATEEPTQGGGNSDNSNNPATGNTGSKGNNETKGSASAPAGVKVETDKRSTVKVKGNNVELALRSGNTAWGSVAFSNCASLDKSYVRLFQVEKVKKAAALNFHRSTMEVQFIAKNRKMSTTCAFTVTFDLTRNERFIYNNYKDQNRINIYWYDRKAREWQACPDVTFDASKGLYGQLRCESTKTGFFALGWPVETEAAKP